MKEQQTTNKSSTSTSVTLVPLSRSDSTSTVILEEPETQSTCHHVLNTLTPSRLASLSFLLRSMQKTSGQFSGNLDLPEKVNEQLSEDDFLFLQDIFNQIGSSDFKFDGDEVARLESCKDLDSRTLSELFRSESFDQLLATLAAQNSDSRSITTLMPCQSTSFSELRPVSPEFLSQSYPEPTSNNAGHSIIYPCDGSVDTLNAVEHDHAFLCKRATNMDSSSASSSSSFSSTEPKQKRIKRSKNISRADDIETPDDLNYYLERRRKNNEASRVSRAIRKQKFTEMDKKCDEYQRVNEQLLVKISTLEKVTASLKNGLVNNFQRK